MDHQVKITLTSLNGDVTPAQRTFTLSPEHSAIPVGRASKSPNKGLLGAADNAWFDSPVMSRHHAQMTFNAEDKTIKIKDIGSMHGTYLNNVPLPAKTAMVVGNKDEVKFGAEVRRGPEIFPACRFRVNYEIVPYKPANTFEFPEYSDIDEEEDEEEEEEYGFSDDANAGRQSSSDDGISDESPRPNPAKIVQAIDLTQEDSPIPSTIIDLTDDSSKENHHMDLKAEHPAHINENGDRPHVSIYAENTMTVVDDSINESLSSESEDQLEEAETSDSESSEEEDGIDELEDIDGSDSDEYPEEYPTEEDYIMEDGFDNVMPGNNSTMRNIHQFAHATNENAPSRLAESISADEPSVDEEDNQSDFGLSDAGAEGLRVLYEGGLLEKLPEHTPLSAPAPASEYRVATDHLTHPNDLVAERAPAVDSSQPVSPPNFTEQSQLLSGEANLEKPLALAYLSIRQPSPSDAAMVKPQVGAAALHNTTPAQSLGEITGKNAFFEAREVNKISAKRFTDPSIVVIGQPDRSVKDLYTTPISFSTLFAPQASKAELIDPTMPTREECSFLDKPDMTPIVPRAATPLVDMTSAAMYTASRKSMASEPNLVNTSRPLRIQDMICDRPLSPPASLKRKAQEISADTEEESKICGDHTSYTMQNNSAGASLINQTPVSQQTPEKVRSIHSLDSPRPTKRFKKFMEKVGYAAIGGVAVGASLFTALVATAPSFS